MGDHIIVTISFNSKPGFRNSFPACIMVLLQWYILYIFCFLPLQAMLCLENQEVPDLVEGTSEKVVSTQFMLICVLCLGQVPSFLDVFFYCQFS